MLVCDNILADMTTTTTTLVLPDGTEVQTTVTVRHPTRRPGADACPGLAKCPAAVIDTDGETLADVIPMRRAS